MRGVEVQRLEAMVQSLRESHQRQVDDLLQARANELKTFDDKLRARDADLNHMHFKVLFMIQINKSILFSVYRWFCVWLI